MLEYNIVINFSAEMANTNNSYPHKVGDDGVEPPTSTMST